MYIDFIKFVLKLTLTFIRFILVLFICFLSTGIVMTFNGILFTIGLCLLLLTILSIIPVISTISNIINEFVQLYQKIDKQKYVEEDYDNLPIRVFDR